MRQISVVSQMKWVHVRMYFDYFQRGNVGDDEFTLMKTVCTVCGQRRCPRHRYCSCTPIDVGTDFYALGLSDWAHA